MEEQTELVSATQAEQNREKEREQHDQWLAKHKLTAPVAGEGEFKLEVPSEGDLPESAVAALLNNYLDIPV